MIFVLFLILFPNEIHRIGYETKERKKQNEFEFNQRENGKAI